MYIYSKTSTIQATFHHLNIEVCPGCTCDYLRFIDSKNETLDTFCGEETGLIRYFSTRVLQYKFKTDGVTNLDGFCIELNCGSEGCIEHTEEKVANARREVMEADEKAAEAETASEAATNSAIRANAEKERAEAAKQVLTAKQKLQL